MRKKSLIIFLLIILLLLPMASAGFFGNWFTGMFEINPEEKPPTESPLPTIVYEQVTCKFLGSTSTQTCYAPNIDQSCTGTDSCTMTIMGAQGSQVYIKACGGTAYATIDSTDGTVEFKCEQPLEKASEQVECIFTNANTVQKCYSVPGQYSCEGLGSCMIQVSGDKGITSFYWRSSCSGESYAVVDGTNKRFEFNCATITPQLSQPVVKEPIAEEVKEEVKCVFKGTTSSQKCYADNGQYCAGTGACATTVVGQKGRQVTWKSSCGGYASTIMDGNNEVIELNCEQTTITPIFEPIKETVVCVFTNYRGGQTCMTDDKKFSCTASAGPQPAKCPVTVYSGSGVYGAKLAWYSTCGGKAITTLDRMDETITFDCRQAAEVPAIIVTPAETVKEQVTCLFLESKQSQKCYSEFGASCEGKTSCVLDIASEKGRKTALKSTCGGYAYIVIDGKNENAEFKCLPREEVAPEQIVGRGFQKAYWECYDGTGAATNTDAAGNLISSVCKPSEVWHREAENYCERHCYQNGSKCGVNSFSVSEECYESIAVPQETTETVQQEQMDLEKIKEEMKKAKLEKDSLAYFYSQNCQHCEGMGEEVDKAAKELGIQVSKIDMSDKGSLNLVIIAHIQEYVNVVPLLLFAKGEKEGGFKLYAQPGEADAQTIIQWVKDIYAGNVKPQEPVDLKKLKEEMEESKEETLFCKDSCPLDGKCYPFGYRKKGMFCSDEGMFKEQLNSEESCDNNFECSSNVCVNNKCLSPGLIEKILSWFKKIFE